MSRLAYTTDSSPGYLLENQFVAAQEYSSLPRGVPETFDPPYTNVAIGDRHLIRSLKGSLVLLASTHAVEPKGQVAIVARELPYLGDYFRDRTPLEAGSPLCTEDTADSLGTYTVVKGRGPTLYCVLTPTMRPLTGLVRRK